jgi:hypothetical protein
MKKRVLAVASLAIAVFTAAPVLSVSSVTAKTPEPTGTPASTSRVKSSAAPLKWVNLTTLAPTIVFGTPEDFRHASGLFIMRVPSNWRRVDASRANEAIAYFVDPSQNVLILARAVVSQTTTQTQDQMSAALVNYVTAQFGKQKGFMAEDPKPMRGNARSTASVTAPLAMAFNFDVAQGGKVTTMFGDALIVRDGAVLTALVLICPKDQYDKIKTDAYAVLNSYKVSIAAAK